MRLRFHTTVHAKPPHASAGPPLTVGGVEVSTLGITPFMLGYSLPTSFEEAAARLQTLPRMFLEPDGSFVWVSSQQSDTWQIDGVLYDRGGRLMFVDLKGECPDESFDQILAALAGSATPLMFQLLQQAVFLDLAEFKRCCRTSDKSTG